MFVIFVVVEVLMPETAMAPTRVILNRSIAGSMLFMFLLLGGLTSGCLLSGDFVPSGKRRLTHTRRHQHDPFGLVPGHSWYRDGHLYTKDWILCSAHASFSMLVSPVLCAVGGGLLSTLSPTSNHSHWIGYQVLYGFGIGCGFQTSNLAAQNVLPCVDVPPGLALMFFMQQLGGSIFLFIGQNIFSDKLVNRLSGVADLDTEAIINTGATDLGKIVQSSELTTVLDAYSYALTRIFIVTAALSACMILGAVAVEWKSIKGPAGASRTAEAKLEEGGERSQERESWWGRRTKWLI
ncbi:hypothetical protein MMC08_004945 [Hypocenomyce scalaris]|nr:hypothetical protein [Hypocenomyce scalaris]